jgi:hypothetical protein
MHAFWLTIFVTDLNREQDSEIGKTVRENLECYICRQKLIAPVSACKQGHYVCGLCDRDPSLYKSNWACGCCSEEVLRFPGMDRMVEYVHKGIDCRYADKGCTHKENARRIIEHIKTCSFGYVDEYYCNDIVETNQAWYESV